ncbi:MAG TPA: DNA repair protein RecN [Gemmatimonadaceae bacterium]|nr:DNA repair protein RecN [Gemmatimonadaceae bacterium]
MLTELRIRNFAIIESLTLPLGPGLNVLTGETGAGKSIVVGALGLLLGERGAADVVRTGSDRATVEGVFDTTARPELKQLLDERGIDVDEALVVLRREVTSSGRTRAWVNGTTVTAAVLADVARYLIDLHGQHEAQSLLDESSQRIVLDAFAGARDEARLVRESYDKVTAVRREISELASRRAEAERRADYLRHVVREIGDAKLIDGEDVRLEEEARRLENASEIRDSAGAMSSMLEDEEGGALTRLAQAGKILHQLQRLDPTLSRLQETYDTGFYAIESLARELADYAASVDLDPARLGVVRARRDLLFRLIKKYGPTLKDAIALGHESRRELDLLDTAGFDLRTLEEREKAAADALRARAERLSAKRADAARRLAQAIDEILPELGMADGRFHIQLDALGEPGPNGAEDVEFRVTLNVGHDMRPLARVASGGELSRIMLALKTILARLDHVPTLVFDEVDAGIGGTVGQRVGEMLGKVAGSHQVFAITHLPQIASRANRHILVSKGAQAGVTTADVSLLSDARRVEEIARMLGGDPESATSRAHAAELLKTAGNRSAARSDRERTSGDRSSQSQPRGG